MNPFRNIKGETISETIIALSILAIGITIASTVSASSLRNMQSARDRIIAVNLAREGIEAVRNIRDTNWLKFSGNRRECWNHNPALTISETCTGISSIANGDYIVYKAKSGDGITGWRLKSAPTDSDLRLHIIDTATGTDTNRDGVNDNDPDLYNHTATDDAIGSVTGTKNLSESLYKRQINIQYLDNNGDDGSPSDNRMQITSTVTWTQAQREFTVQLKTIITDYLGRENLN